MLTDKFDRLPITYNKISQENPEQQTQEQVFVIMTQEKLYDFLPRNVSTIFKQNVTVKRHLIKMVNKLIQLQLQHHTL